MSAQIPANPSWVHVCAIDEIPLLGSRVLQCGEGDDIALFRPAAERVFALAAREAGGCQRRILCSQFLRTFALESGAAIGQNTAPGRTHAGFVATTAAGRMLNSLRRQSNDTNERWHAPVRAAHRDEP